MTDTVMMFQKPWHAQISAIVHALKEAGTFTAVEWSQTLGAERARQQACGVSDGADSYFTAVLDSLLVLMDRADPAIATDLRDTTQAWRSAYLSTPHGHPVDLPATAQ